MTMRKALRQKNTEQKLRQRNYRERLRLERKPTRDDCARVLLHTYVLTFAQDEGVAQDAMDGIVRKLMHQGFAEDPSYEVIEAIFEKYTKRKWQFRRKPHLINAGMRSAGI